MRIKISGQILSKPPEKKALFTHSIYSMLLNRLPIDLAQEAHGTHTSKFTFSTIIIDYISDSFSFYFSSTEDNCVHLAESFEDENMFRVESYHLGVSAIDVMPELDEKDSYLFKGKLLISDKHKNIIEDKKEQAYKLKGLALSKLKPLGLSTDIEFEVFDYKKTETLYKRRANMDSIHAIIPGFYAMFRVKGNYESIAYLYSVGFGQNSSTGNGLVWEVGL